LLPLATKAPSAMRDYGSQYWVEADFLGWTVTGDKLSALVTTSPLGTPAPFAGVLGAPGTTVLFGNLAANDNWRAGGRLAGGYWFDPSHKTGIEASFFGLANASTGFNANSGGAPILAQPFTNAMTGVRIHFSAPFLVSFPVPYRRTIHPACSVQASFSGKTSDGGAASASAL
jgi:hypothetical protein